MDWVALAVLGIIWAILLVPPPRRREPPSPLRRERPIEEQDFNTPGRWVLSPRRNSRFVGRRIRARLRARERRRRVYLFLLEAIALTGLIGVFPPLRGMLVVTAFITLALAAYTGLVVTLARQPPRPARAVPLSDVVVVLPEARPGPEFQIEARDHRHVRIAAR